MNAEAQPQPQRSAAEPTAKRQKTSMDAAPQPQPQPQPTAAEPAAKRQKTTDDLWRRLGSPRSALAPLVDQSELAYRLLCRSYGAGICWTPMMDAKRFVADAAYRLAVFEAGAGAPADRPLVAQFAGDDPATILAAARLVEHRVDVVELNCGCPQKVARKGHFGAFLLDEPEVILAVVRALKRGLATACVEINRWFGTSRPNFEMI